MKITFLGHSCFQIESDKGTIVFDPFIRPNPKAAHIDFDQLKADYILLSHGHMDHVADAKDLAANNDAMIVSNYEIVTWYENQGIAKIHPLNHGGQVKLPFGSAKYVNAVHSSVLPDGTYGGNPGGFVVSLEGKKFYYSGDTALHMDMELIGRLDRPDFAFLCIGDNFTMGIEDALEAAKMTKVKKVIGMHFNTFPYIEIDTDAAKEMFAKEGIDLVIMNIGESIEV